MTRRSDLAYWGGEVPRCHFLAMPLAQTGIKLRESTTLSRLTRLVMSSTVAKDGGRERVRHPCPRQLTRPSNICVGCTAASPRTEVGGGNIRRRRASFPTSSFGLPISQLVSLFTHCVRLLPALVSPSSDGPRCTRPNNLRGVLWTVPPSDLQAPTIGLVSH
jgi:hypothetical protein